MTNEQLAIAIQNGDTSLHTALWEQVYKLLYSMARKYYNRYKEQLKGAGAVLEDLYQECYMVMLDAVRAYDESKEYRFTSYFKYFTMNRFNSLAGFRTAKERKNLLNNSISLDMAIGDGEDNFTLSDTIEDKNAKLDYENVEERLYLQALHNDLDICLDTLEPQQRTAVVGRLYDNTTLDKLSSQMGVTREHVRQLEHKGLRSLRSGKCIRILRLYHEDILASRCYISVGLSSFKQNNLSVEQRTIEQLEQFHQWNRTGTR